MAEELIIELCSNLNLDAPELQKDKSYLLRINEYIDIKVWYLDPGYYFNADLLPPPTRNREDFFSYIMSANVLGQGTGGSRIGLDIEEKFLTLSYMIPYAPNYKEFKETIEDFVNYVIYWKDEITRYKKEIESSIV